MTRSRYITIDGRRYLWRDVLQWRREQKAAPIRSEQPPLFHLKHDPRPASQRTASARYREPSLFSDH